MFSPNLPPSVEARRSLSGQHWWYLAPCGWWRRRWYSPARTSAWPTPWAPVLSTPAPLSSVSATVRSSRWWSDYARAVRAQELRPLLQPHVRGQPVRHCALLIGACRAALHKDEAERQQQHTCVGPECFTAFVDHDRKKKETTIRFTFDTRKPTASRELDGSCCASAPSFLNLTKQAPILPSSAPPPASSCRPRNESWWDHACRYRSGNEPWPLATTIFPWIERSHVCSGSASQSPKKTLEIEGNAGKGCT
jgi:hypothetical protein